MALAAIRHTSAATDGLVDQSPQDDAHCACHVLGGLAWRGSWLSRAGRRWPDEPGLSDGARRLYLTGLDHLLCHCPAGPGITPHRHCFVARYRMGLDPLLLGLGETPNHAVCYG